MLSNQLRQEVTDATGIKGAYVIHVQWATDPAAASGVEIAPALPQALQEQVGLKLEPKKGPVDTLVIDHMDREPTGN